ncbi:MAG: TerC family protein [Candidatus Methylacidiphilales bacterium]|nr:TerC family protein [Candidatus Methylacidiphilales bacterium]
MNFIDLYPLAAAAVSTDTAVGIILSLVTLTILEIVLGIDNVIFIAILAGKLPEHERDKARNIGLGLALVMRVLLLMSLSYVIALKDPIYTIDLPAYGIDDKPFGITVRDIVLFAGGIFLLYKSTHEIHNSLEGEEHHGEGTKVHAAFGPIVGQIILLDLVFSLDSVITAIGMASQIWVMIAAVVISMIFMLAFSGWVAGFVNNHPTVKMLALAFLMLIGFTLVIEGFHVHVPKGYIYFAMAFSVAVESLNLIAKGRKKQGEPVHLRKAIE